MWEELRKTAYNDLDWAVLTEHSIKIKAKITEEDPNEMGLRKILNFGHTIGHAIESFYLETPKKLLHGEAIAIGMIAESYVAFEKGFLSKRELSDIKSYITSVFGHISIDRNDYAAIIPLTLQDKKNEHNVVLASLLKIIGEANFNIELNSQEIKKGLDFYNQAVTSTVY